MNSQMQHCNVNLAYAAITDQSINALANYCKELVELRVDNCDSPFSVKSVTTLIVECPKLRWFAVSSRDKDFRAFVKSAKSLYPHLILWLS